MRLGFASKILIAVFALVVLFLALPIVRFNGVGDFLTAATFLFGVLYGFEISVVIANFVALKTQLAIENAGLRSIFHLADIMGGKAGEEIKKRIEEHILELIDYPLEKHLETDRSYFNIFEPLKTAPDPEKASGGQALQYLNEGIYYIPQARDQVADVAPRFVNLAEWIMLVVLGIFLVGALFLGRGPELFSQITAAVFSSLVIGSLLLLYEIDSNRVMEAYLEYGMFNETLKSIGKTHYYPEFAIKQGVVKILKGEKYRLGIFPHYPSFEGRRIEIRE